MNKKTVKTNSMYLGKLAVILLVLSLVLMLPHPAQAVTSGGHVFLKGTYIQVGIHSNGYFGAPRATIPAGYINDVHTANGLGFVADYQRDGWANGTPAFGGDYFTPGVPYEGFGVKWGSTTFSNAGSDVPVSQIPMQSLTETTSGDTQSAVWVGEVTSGSDKLKVIQTVSFKTGDLFFTMNIQLINTGATTLSNVKYQRGVDPDNDVTWPGGSYTTTNVVVHQPGVGGNVDKALVTATGTGYTDMTLGLGAIDSRAKVTAQTAGFAINPDEVLNTPVSGPVVADKAIGLAFNLGNLAPGQSASFDLAYILSASDLTTALGSLAAVTILSPTGTVSGSAVPFRVSTNNVPQTSLVEFYINGVKIGEDSTPSGDIFETTFNSNLYPNGPINIRAVATINGTLYEKISTVNVDNTGPAISFVTPIAGSTVSGDNIPVEISVDDPSNPPVRVTFYRESGGTVALGTDTTAPFSTTFNTADLPAGASIVIRAIGTNAAGLSSNITVGLTKAAGSAPSSFSAATPGNGTYGSTYTPYTFVANGDPAPTYSVVGTLPPGLTLNPTTGQLSGTPSAAGTYSNIVVRATNDFGSFDSSPFTIVIAKADTTTTITGDLPDPSLFGQSYTVGVSVASATTGTPGGTVVVSDGNGNSCNVTLTGGTGSCSMPSTLVGTPTLTASYAGNSNFNSSADTEAHTVDKADSALGLASSDLAAVYGQALTFTATASAVAPGSGTPTGNVQFSIDGIPYGEPVTLSGGSAQLLLPYNHLLVGEYTISAVYSGDSGFNGSSAPVISQSVKPAATSLIVQSSENPTQYGVSLDVTVTVSSEAPGDAIPAGMVQLYIDGIPFGSPLPLDASGKVVRQVPYLNLWPGSHGITAVYTPSVAPHQFTGSDNIASPFNQVVNKANPVFTITPSVAAPLASEPVTYQVLVGPSLPTQGVPTGTVQFYVDGVPLGSPVELDAEGKAASPTSISLGAGDHQITVGYSGDDYFSNVPSSPALPQNVQPAATTTTILSISPDEVVVGQPVTVSVKVSANPPADGKPGGTVTVSNGLDSCIVTLDADGSGSCDLVPTSPTVPGSPLDLTASYAGTPDFLGGFSTPFTGPSVSKADAAASISSFVPANPVVGQPVTIRFTVSPVAPGWGVPTGTVTVSAGNGLTCTVDVEVGECSLIFTEAGPTSLSLAYAGDANFNPAETLAIAGPSILKAGTDLSVASSVATSVFGQPVEFTATVSVVAPGVGTPTGMVQFKVDGENYGAPVPLTDNQAVSSPISSLAVGNHTYSAEYLGDLNFASVAAGSSVQTVIKADTSISLASSLNPSPYGLPVLVTATVTANLPSEAVPQSGSVQFIVDGVNYGAPVPLNASGQATKLLPYTALWVGSHNITAVYSGSASFNGCTTAAPLVQVVEKGDLTITLVPSVVEPVFGQLFNFTSTVVGNGGNNPKPTGTVQFVVDGVNLGSPVALDANAKAVSEMISNLSAGAHAVRLVYSGDDYYVAKTIEVAQGVVVAKADTLPEIIEITPSNPLVGQPMTIHFRVQAVAPGAGTPSGDVTISDGVNTCTAVLAEDGTGSCQLSAFAVGPTSFTIQYAGDANFNSALPGAAVDGPEVGPASTNITILSADPANVVVGQPYVVTVRVVSELPSVGVPSGLVTISNGNDSCQATLQPDGTASCEIVPTQAAAQLLIATFAGDLNYTGSVSTPQDGPTVDKADTVTGVTLSMNPLLEGESVHFNATVHAAAPGNGTPTGQVQFKLNGVNTGEPVDLVGGVAVSPSMNGLVAGVYTVSAEYLADANYNASASASLTMQVLVGDLRVEIKPGEPGQIRYETIEDGVPVSVIIDLPAGIVDQNTVLVFRRIHNSLLTPLAGMNFVMNFTLEAYVDGILVPNLAFNTPAAVTVKYNHTNWYEDTLVAKSWNGSGWSGTGITTGTQDLANNTYTFSLAGTGPEEFSLMAKRQYKFYLPVMASGGSF